MCVCVCVCVCVGYDDIGTMLHICNSKFISTSSLIFSPCVDFLLHKTQTLATWFITVSTHTRYTCNQFEALAHRPPPMIHSSTDYLSNSCTFVRVERREDREGEREERGERGGERGERTGRGRERREERGQGGGERGERIGRGHVWSADR